MNVYLSQELFILFIAIINFAIAAYVLLSGFAKRVNRHFFLFALGATVWESSVALLFLTHQVFLNEFILYGGIVMMYGFSLLAMVFPENDRLPKWTLPYSLPFLFVLCAIPFNVFVRTIVLDAHNNPRPVNGPLFFLYATIAVLYAAAGVAALQRKLKRLEGSAKLQASYLLWGSAIFIALALLADAILPAFGIFQFNILGPAASIILVGTVAYAIVRHHLFDIRIITTDVFTLVLNILILSRVVIARNLFEFAGGVGVFLGTLIFSILLIRSVRREVAQREELQRLTEKLEEANAHLSDLSHFKSQLLSIASHQIKSPLAIIKGYLTLVLQGLYGPVGGNVKTTLDKVKQSTDSLTQLIEDLLNLRRAEEGRMDYKFAKTDLGALVAGVAGNFAPLALRKGLEFTVVPPPAPIFANGDETKLKEVFQNLLDNALKYTPRGFIRVEMRAAETRAEVSIKDSGIGMPHELLSRLFGEFVRDERIQKEIQGSGFGLYVAKKIIEAHGGSIWAESPGEGKGSGFFVSLPLFTGK